MDGYTVIHEYALTLYIGGDFNKEVIEFMFRNGSEDATATIVGHTLPIDDSKSEPDEGFLLYVKIDESSLDSRDVERITFQKSVLVTIIGK